ncbi:MAG: zinc ribbon domain-containing protein, partial [Candidatus Latescibacterota bacterium]
GIGRLMTLRQCPYCGEKIKTEAIKCRYCGSFSEPEKMAKPCIFCRVMIGVSVALLLIWLIVFVGISG